jgi:hypothetical protein
VFPEIIQSNERRASASAFVPIFRRQFEAIEREQEARGTLSQSADRIKAILGA